MIEFSCFKRKLFSEITEIPIFFQQKHLPSLDGLRAFSVFYVIAFHWYLGWAHDAEKDIYLPDMVQSALQEGILGVHFFFILSGFLITSLLLKEKIVHQAISFKNFYFRRAFRILPIAILYLLVVIVLNVIFDKDVKANNIIFPLFFAENLDINYHYYTAHYWSLAVEEQFYLFFPFMITLKILNYYRVALILLIIAPAVHYIFTHHCPGNPFLRHVLHFVNIILNRGLLSILIGTFLSIVLFKFKFTIQINKYLY